MREDEKKNPQTGHVEKLRNQKLSGFLTAELEVTKEGRQEGQWCPTEKPMCSQTVRRKEGSQTRILRKLTCETPSSRSHSVPPKRYCKRGQRKVGIWEIELPLEERHHGVVRGPQDSCVPNNSALFVTALPLGSAPTPLPCFVTWDLHPRYISFTHVTWSRLVSREYSRTLQEEGASLGFKTDFLVSPARRPADPQWAASQ